MYVVQIYPLTAFPFLSLTPVPSAYGECLTDLMPSMLACGGCMCVPMHMCAQIISCCYEVDRDL